MLYFEKKKERKHNFDEYLAVQFILEDKRHCLILDDYGDNIIMINELGQFNIFKLDYDKVENWEDVFSKTLFINIEVLHDIEYKKHYDIIIK